MEREEEREAGLGFSWGKQEEGGQLVPDPGGFQARGATAALSLAWIWIWILSNDAAPARTWQGSLLISQTQMPGLFLCALAEIWVIKVKLKGIKNILLVPGLSC